MDNIHYAEQDGLRFAGTHLLLDMWGARNLADAAAVEAILCDAASACGATLLHMAAGIRRSRIWPARR